MAKKNVSVLPLKPLDISAYEKLAVEGKNSSYFQFLGGSSLSKEDLVVDASNTKTRISLVRDGGKVVGCVKLGPRRLENNQETLHIYITDPSKKNRTLFYDVLVKIVDTLFNEQQTTKIVATFFKYEDHLRQLFSDIGFQQEVVMTEHFYSRGVYETVLLFGLIKEDL
ncbi:hypothetical protein ACFL56_02525 [Candidatus Margulisiibacteriota bacterium]